MRFIVTDEAIKRLELRPALSKREFSGPSIREGLLGGFQRGILRWLKKELKVVDIGEIDAVDARLCYYLLVMKNEDHTLLPFSRLDELARTDFELVKHVVTSRDPDGDCGECSSPLDSILHLDPDDPRVEVPPTTAPPSEETPTG